MDKPKRGRPIRIRRADGKREEWRTTRGRLIRGDAVEVLPELRSGAYAAIFADPPFNLGKAYGDSVNDLRKPDEYLAWCRRWLNECVRLLAPGGSLFVYNLPRWNIHLAAYLENRLTFRNWIAVEMKYSLPVRSRLYPAHYSLLYFVKGNRAATFDPPRQPMVTCRHCGLELKDYGGYKDKLNPGGFNLSDVWSDLSPVRHRRFKWTSRTGNQLPIKMMDRILDIATTAGDRVLDPFAGSGTTLVTAELKGRRWTGIEIESVAPIVERFGGLAEDRSSLAALARSKNRLFTDEAIALRIANGHGLGAYRALVDHELAFHHANGRAAARASGAHSKPAASVDS